MSNVEAESDSSPIIPDGETLRQAAQVLNCAVALVDPENWAVLFENATFFKQLVAPVFKSFSEALLLACPDLDQDQVNWFMASIVGQVQHFIFRRHKWDSLPQDIQDAIMSVSGEAGSKFWGRHFFDDMRAEGLAKVLRYANRVPLLYMGGACAMTKAMNVIQIGE